MNITSWKRKTELLREIFLTVYSSLGPNLGTNSLRASRSSTGVRSSNKKLVVSIWDSNPGHLCRLNSRPRHLLTVACRALGQIHCLTRGYYCSHLLFTHNVIVHIGSVSCRHVLPPTGHDEFVMEPRCNRYVFSSQTPFTHVHLLFLIEYKHDTVSF